MLPPPTLFRAIFMVVNSLALLQSFDSKPSSPRQAKRTPTAPVEPELVALELPGGAGKSPHQLSVNGTGVGLKFSVDEATGVTVIRVYDTETGDLIRQMPPDEALAFLKHYQEQRGVLFSRKL